MREGVACESDLVDGLEGGAEVAAREVAAGGVAVRSVFALLVGGVEALDGFGGVAKERNSLGGGGGVAPFVGVERLRRSLPAEGIGGASAAADR